MYLNARIIYIINTVILNNHIEFKKHKKKLTALNDQQDPHCPWFLTGVTYPFFLQSTDAGITTFSDLKKVTASLV